MARAPCPRPAFGGIREADITRRAVLQGIGAGIGTAAVGCGGSSDASAPSASAAGVGGAGGGTGASTVGAGAGGTGTGGTGGATSGPGSGGGGAPGDCKAPSDLSPEELLAPIDVIVVLMLENRSFDHYLGGSLGLVEGRPDILGLSGAESNPSASGDVAVFAMDNLTPASPPHGWDAVHAQWNMGKLDGFVKAHAGPNEKEVMGYYVRKQVPIHCALADAYATCNRWHASVLGPTWPNRFYLHGATSKGQKGNQPVSGFESIFDVLKDAGVAALNYHHGVAFATGGYFKLDGLATMSEFKQHAKDGKLPKLSIIDPAFFGAGANDDHPSNGDIPAAQLLVSDVYSALAASPQWSKCLFVVTYDEHGGFFDHVPPTTTTDDYPEFAQLGIRVPGLVVGPYVRHGCTVDTVFDHASVIATVARKHGLPPLNARAGAAADLSSCLDPALVKAKTPQSAVTLPVLEMSMSALRRFSERVRRGEVEQHPELRASLEAQGLWRSLVRRHDPDRVLGEQLDDCVRKGILRLVD
jgi:phospholipase C